MLRTFAFLAAPALLATACTVHQSSPAPALTGPSEAALSVALSASPDSLSQDGRSNSTITVIARDPNGRGMANVSFRLDMRVDSQPSDYGTLSSKNLMTGADGKATAIYTSPAPPPPGTAYGSCSGGITTATVAGNCVEIVATPVGTDFDSASSHSITIHLVPTGVIIPGSATPSASFTVATPAPIANSPVLFDASQSCAGQLQGGACPGTAGTIVSYAWNFGDGGTGTGRTATHTFTSQQSYLVTLTVTNDKGLAASTTTAVQMGAGAVPTAAFTSSPTAPAPGDMVFFDGTLSKPGTGHSIVRYVWNFGDGTFYDSSVPTASHKYVSEGNFVVTLNVQDEVGQTSVITGTVAVKVPTTTTTP